MRVIPVACWRDNYAWVAHEEHNPHCVVVDATDADAVTACLVREQLTLSAVLCTHHHHDHVAGVAALAAAHPGVPVYAHTFDRGRIEGVTACVDDGDGITAAGITFRAMHVPGHTLGALTWVAGEGSATPWAFTGDTLFLAGCGRLFEGAPHEMYDALTRITALDEATLLACGHEYTEANLRFAAHVEPHNEAVAARIERVRALRAQGLPSVPGTVRDERATNVFVRVREAAVRRFVEADASTDDVEVFRRLRAAKDTFRA